LFEHCGGHLYARVKTVAQARVPEIDAGIPAQSFAEGPTVSECLEGLALPGAFRCPFNICVVASVVARVKDHAFRLPIADTGRDAGSADGKIRPPFEAFHCEQVGFAGEPECFPGTAFGWRVHKSTHQEVLSPVGCPHELKAGNWRPLPQLLPVINQGFRDTEVIRLVDEREAMRVEPFLNSAHGQSTQIEIQKAEQVEGGNAVLDRHPVTSLQDDRLTAGHQHQAVQGVDGRSSCATVKRHAEAERSFLISRTVKNGPHRSVGVEHAREFLGLGPADAMGDQKGPNLCRSGFLPKHQCQSIGSFLSTQTFAGVLTASDFAQVLLEAVATA